MSNAPPELIAALRAKLTEYDMCSEVRESIARLNRNPNVGKDFVGTGVRNLTRSPKSFRQEGVMAF